MKTECLKPMSEDPDLLRQCAASGQMSASQIEQHFPRSLHDAFVEAMNEQLSRVGVGLDKDFKVVFVVRRPGED